MTPRLMLATLVVALLAGCGGGADESAEVEVAVQGQYPGSEVTCTKTDVEYGDGYAYACTVGKKPICATLVDGELLELWDERPLRPGEEGYSPDFVVTVKDGPSC